MLGCDIEKLVSLIGLTLGSQFTSPQSSLKVGVFGRGDFILSTIVITQKYELSYALSLSLTLFQQT
jgi:hypothetical protein